MATYEMVCSTCDNTFEVFRTGFLKNEDKVCPKCDSTEVRQKFTSFLRNFGSGGASSSDCGPRIGGFG